MRIYNTMKYIIQLVIMILCLLSIDIYAQNTSVVREEYEYEVSPVKERKSHTMRSNIFKINVASAISGDLSFFYERVFDEFIGLEIGAGTMLTHHIPDPLMFLIVQNEGYSQIKNVTGGYSLWGQGKLYESGDGLNDTYWALQIRRRQYIMETKYIAYNDITFMNGIQRVIYDQIFFEFNMGLGFQVMQYGKGALKFNDLDYMFVLPVTFKVGYAF